MHFEAEVRCPMCGHDFRVCVDAATQPAARQMFSVCCPSNASRFQVAGSLFRPVEACSGGVDGVEFVRPDSRIPRGERGAGRDGFGKRMGCATLFGWLGI